MTNLKNLDIFFNNLHQGNAGVSVEQLAASGAYTFQDYATFNFRQYATNFQTCHIRACSDWVAYFSAFSEVWSFFFFFII